MTQEWSAQVFHRVGDGVQRDETFLYFHGVMRQSEAHAKAMFEAESRDMRDVRIGDVVRGHHVKSDRRGVCCCHAGQEGCTP